MQKHSVFRHQAIVSLIVLLALVVSLISLFGSSGARVHASASAALNAPTEGPKLTLGQTSIDGPALWTASAGAVRAVMSWTGTDPTHHLNLLSSADGVTWDSKVVLSETSPFRPGLTRAGSNSGDSVVLAWAGSDPNRSLNLLVGNPPAGYAKVTLRQENSFTAPGVAILNGGYYLAWAGTDSAHSLNVDRIVASGGTLVVMRKTTLQGWGSLASPSILLDPNTGQLVMSWTGTDSRLHVAESPDGAQWTQQSQSLAYEWSDSSPMAYSASAANVASNLPRYFVAWRGVNAAHSINVKYTTSFPVWPQSFEKTTLNEESLGGPALGSIGASAQLLLAWTGVDAAHHLNVATVSAPYASACVPASGAQPVSPVVISHGATGTKEVSLTFDSDGGSAGAATAYLDILHAHGIHASFFVTGAFAQVNPAIVQRIVNEGHDIGNHTIDHPDLANPLRTDTFVCNELTGADGTISGVAGRSTRPYFRPPYGSYNEQTQYLAAGIGYRTILWSIDPVDWNSSTTVQDILNRVLNSPNLAPGAIILMHVNSVNERYALDSVITGLQQRGYTIVPLSQLLR